MKAMATMRTTAMMLTVSAVFFQDGSALGQTAMDPIESYCATMGRADHFASDGYRLKDAAAIIRQDRANFHAFNKRDPSDEDDSTFGSKANRARLERMLKNGNISRSVASSIVNGTPDVCIDVYGDFINVVVTN